MRFLIRLGQLKTELAILALIAFGFSIFASPYVTQREIERAVHSHRSTDVERFIDLSGVRDNTATWMQGQLGEITPILGGGGPIGNFVSLGGIAQLLGSAYIRMAIAKEFTMTTVTQALQAVVQSDPGASRQSPRTGTFFSMPSMPDNYRDFSRFEFWSRNERVPVHVVMCRENLVQWKVCGFEGKDVVTELSEDLAKYLAHATKR